MQVEMILLGVLLLTLAVNSSPVDRVKRQYRVMPNFLEDFGEPCEPGDCLFGYQPFRGSRTTASQRGRALPRGYPPIFAALDLPFAPPAGILGVAPRPPGSPPAAASAAPPDAAPVLPPVAAPVAPRAGGALGMK